MSAATEAPTWTATVLNAGPMRAEVSQRSIVRPGYSPVDAVVRLRSSRRDWSLRLPAPYGGEGSIEDSVDETNALADLIVETINEGSMDIASLEARCVRAEATASRQDGIIEDLRRNISSVLTGKPPHLFGRGRVEVNEDGSCWLMDPEKRGSGYSLRYLSLTDLWRDKPALRPVEWGFDHDGPFMIVDTISLETRP